MKHYTIEYQEHQFDTVHQVFVPARNKLEAYHKFINDDEFGSCYAAWVARVTCNNGNVREFNTFAGKPF